jgi:hypothetical protein
MSSVTVDGPIQLDRAARSIGNGLKAIFIATSHNGKPFTHWLRTMDSLPDPAVIAKVMSRHRNLLFAGKEIQGKSRDGGFKPCRLTLETQSGSLTILEELDSTLFASFVFERDIPLGLVRAQVHIGLESIRDCMRLTSPEPKREADMRDESDRRADSIGSGDLPRESHIRKVIDHFRNRSPDGHAALPRLAMQARVTLLELTNDPERLNDETKARIEQKACLLMGVTFPMKF